MSFAHTPVLLDEVVQLVTSVAPRLIVDCTVGGAGHARALLAACSEARLVGIDRDTEALAAAAAALAPFAGRVHLVRAPFSQVERVVDEAGLGRADALLVDLGVSSHQLDVAERGFSFRAEGPLDMRMDRGSGESAADVLGSIDEATLAGAIHTLGEERHARRVARAIVASRPRTTGELADVVRRVVPRAKDGIDPATRTFQAIRMLVNRELEELAAWLAAVPRVLAPGGLALAISFHSLEDRAVKLGFRDAARDCVCPPGLPACACGHRATLALVTRKPITAGAVEVAGNPRARSAKLRAARRLPEAA